MCPAVHMRGYNRAAGPVLFPNLPALKEQDFINKYSIFYFLFMIFRHLSSGKTYLFCQEGGNKLNFIHIIFVHFQNEKARWLTEHIRQHPKGGIKARDVTLWIRLWEEVQ